MRKTLIPLAVAALLVAGCGIDSSYVDPSGGTTAKGSGYDAAKDVTVKHCEADEFGTITAKLKVVNHDTKPRNYLITAEAVVGSERIAELNAVANDVRPGQTTTEEATGSADSQPKKTFTCRMVSVNSFTS